MAKNEDHILIVLNRKNQKAEMMAMFANRVPHLCVLEGWDVYFPHISVVRGGMGKQIRNTEKAELEGHCDMGLPPCVTPKTGKRNLLNLLSPEDEAVAFRSFTSIGFHRSGFFFFPSCQALVIQRGTKAKV